ncbi:hypothetical protein MC885_020417, partial [Smutsia gigantea]
MCLPRDYNHSTPEPTPPERRRGHAFSQSGPASPGCPTYGVAVAVQGEDMGRPGPEARALHPGSRLVRLPSASLASGSTGQEVLPPRKEDPSKVSEFPGPLPSEPLSPSGGGGGTGDPRLQAWTTRDAEGPGAAYLGPRYREQGQPAARSPVLGLKTFASVVTHIKLQDPSQASPGRTAEVQ